MSLLPHLRKLAGHSALYGSADVFASLINFALLPVYTRYLGTTDYGNYALLLMFGAVAKIAFRMGLDAGFFRIHYDLGEEGERRRLAGTVALFTAGAGGVMLALVALSKGPLTRALLGPQAPESWVVLVAADVYLGSFAFVPASLLRIQERPGLFSASSVFSPRGQHGAQGRPPLARLRRVGRAVERRAGHPFVTWAEVGIHHVG